MTNDRLRSNPAPGGEPDFAPSSETPGGYVGQAAFDCCRAHRMIARKVLAVPRLVQQAAPGNVSTRGLPEACSIVRIKEEATGVAVSGDVRGSRLPNTR
jgi:hypothetical protein